MFNEYGQSKETNLVYFRNALISHQTSSPSGPATGWLDWYPRTEAVMNRTHTWELGLVCQVRKDFFFSLKNPSVTDTAQLSPCCSCRGHLAPTPTCHIRAFVFQWTPHPFVVSVGIKCACGTHTLILTNTCAHFLS